MLLARHRHKVSCNSRNDGSKCVLTTWRALSARPHSEAVPSSAHLRWLCLGEHRVQLARSGAWEHTAHGGHSRQASSSGRTEHDAHSTQASSSSVGALVSVPAEQGGHSTRTSSGGACASGHTELDGHSRDESDGDGRGRRRRAPIEGEVADAVEFEFLLGFLGRPEDTEGWGHAAVGPRTYCSPRHRMLFYTTNREFKVRVDDDAGNIYFSLL